jgi:cytoplasmic iron level regulating protein YaaA (DUF328/UPF0246 family)
VYSGIDAPSLDAQDLKFAQASVRLLSGLYGVIRPLDLIAPYRLEMGTRLDFVGVIFKFLEHNINNFGIQCLLVNAFEILIRSHNSQTVLHALHRACQFLCVSGM